MTVRLYPPDASQDPGFYHYLFSALSKYEGAELTNNPRPLRRLEEPRQHESIWIEWAGILVLVDMSDHIFMIDLPALQKCDIYFKANLNKRLARKILIRAGLTEHESKLRPFLFLPPLLASCALFERFTRPLRRASWRPFDYCHVVGVYENPFRDSLPPEASLDIAANSQTNHFWIRYQIQQALLASGMKGFCRLTNRGNTALIGADGVVKPNIDSRIFMLAITSSRITVLNSLPHAVFPWKAMESIALGVPFVVERRPLAAMPEEFELVPGKHFLELLPELPGFDERADPDDIHAYRLFPAIRLDRLRERVQWLKDQVCNADRMAMMYAEVATYRRRVLRPAFVSEFLAKNIKKFTKGSEITDVAS